MRDPLVQCVLSHPHFCFQSTQVKAEIHGLKEIKNIKEISFAINKMPPLKSTQ